MQLTRVRHLLGVGTFILAVAVGVLALKGELGYSLVSPLMGIFLGLTFVVWAQELKGTNKDQNVRAYSIIGWVNILIGLCIGAFWLYR
jgi:hypothetical protein